MLILRIFPHPPPRLPRRRSPPQGPPRQGALGLNIVVALVVYYVTIVASGHGVLYKILTFGYRLIHKEVSH